MNLIIEKQNKALFYSGHGEYSGVIKIAGKVRNDIKLVTGSLPAETDDRGKLGPSAVIYGTIGKNAAVEDLVHRRVIDTGSIRGKRECFLFRLVKDPLPGVACALVIAGSDKRGTIYGLFHLSEVMGVSPLVDWADVRPVQKNRVVLTENDTLVSREPSVRFRGFFINDEWPAFGNWAEKRFGGVNARLYEHVFELLLRLKGNYLWPAMWASRFSEDGPGLAGAELADEYGVVMGMSHHEPCLRHGEEYRHLRGRDSIYGDAWNFRTNREGITRFWQDGLKRNGRFENVITVGMRGEQDTAIMGKGASLADNIELLRDVLKTQNELIRENVNPDLDKVPRMLALYKEVEAYFYGDENTPGLLGNEELDGVILMLCDDNFGNLRTLPTREMRGHKGGYGMYYHFDYHGWPVSYEWINSSYLPKIWEQMTTAYDFGIDQLWVVNIGDICTQEFPLSFFLDLAYDFDRWGTSAVNTTDRYTRQWVDRQFAGHIPDKERETICEILTEYTRISSMRRPEAMHAGVYHPVHYAESDRMLARVDEVIRRAEDLRTRTPEAILPAFYELVYYPAVGTMNVQKMQLLAGKNIHAARRGSRDANRLADKVGKCIERDRRLVTEYHHINGGKWYGMGLSEHVGFVNWNEEECRYPLQTKIEPANKPRAIVSVVGTDQSTQGGSWTGKTLYLNDFRRPDVDNAVIEIACGSAQPITYEITCDKPWLRFSAVQGKTALADRITVTMDRQVRTNDTQAEILVRAAGNTIKILVQAAPVAIPADPMTFVETDGYVSMEAEHYHTKGDTPTAGFKRLAGYGKTLSGMKVFPTTASFIPGKDAPYLEYRFVASREGEYTAVLYMAPSNPVAADGVLCYGIQVNQGGIVVQDAVPRGQKVGDLQNSWGEGVLNNIRKRSSAMTCVKGINALRIYAISPGLVLERIVAHPAGDEPPESCLGPTESFFVSQ